jgi:hypothetical protein
VVQGSASRSFYFALLATAFTIVLVAVLSSEEFWFSAREASKTAARANDVLRAFNVFYNEQTCKLFHLPRYVACRLCLL